MDYSQRLHAVIPGGAHTYSRGDDQYPANAPQILARGQGAYVYTPEDEEYLDYGMGLRSVTLGYAEKNVAEAAMRQILAGNNLTRASLVELEAAELFTEIIPSAERVKFAKHGSTVTTAAVKVARAATGRKYVARCLDHPFFSFDDWFIGDTPLIYGIPPEYRALTLHFSYNDTASLEALFDAHPGEIACVILEPATVEHPRKGFLESVRALCTANDTLLIFDEMITGFRWHLQGAQTYYGVEPDLCTFGKAAANGFSVAALAGKREFMELGGITQEGKEKLFLVSTTHGAEMCGMGAFIETVRQYRERDVVSHLWRYGEKLIAGAKDLAKSHGIDAYFAFSGVPCSPVYTTLDKEGKACLGMRTLFSQEMVRHRVLMPWVALSFAHGDAELDRTLSAVNKALAVYAKALDSGFERFLAGPVMKPVFRKYV
jgi:glutamate-1-semialdehyde 2,1-aminomutase